MIKVPLTAGANTITAQVFDKAKNVTTKTLPITLDAAAETSYTYDNNGNLIQKSYRGEQAIYSYNYDNQLTKIFYPDGSRTEYTYDTRGKRRTWDVGCGTKINYFYDGNTAIIERDEAGKTIASYTRGLSLGGGIGSIISKHEAGKDYYYLYDGQGNVTHLTDEDGTVIMRYEYDAFGSIVYQDGSLENSYQYQTKEYDAQSGLVYFGARYYDPAIGRFTTADPLGMVDGPNRYIYCSNNPIGFVDPWGLWGEKRTLWEKIGDYWNDYLKDFEKNINREFTHEEIADLTIASAMGSVNPVGGWGKQSTAEVIKRSSGVRSNFLKSIIEKSPRWMKQWLSKGKTPQGYQVHHYEPLYKGGSDTMQNMRLIDIDMHKLVTKLWRTK